MAYEFLKKLFGKNEDGTPKPMTYEELEAAIDAEKSIKVVDISAGGYVSKDKFDSKDTELKGVKKQLDDANEQIKSFEGQDIEGVKQSVKDWETKYNQDTQDLKDQMAKQQREFAEEMFMSGYKFTSKAAKNGVLAELRAKNFQLDNGAILGGKEFMQSLMENEEYKGAFVIETKGDEGNTGAGAGSGTGTGGTTGTGTQPPRFSQGAAGTQPGSQGSPINFGFTRIRQPKNEN